MSSSLRRGALAATVLAISTATLAACGVGHDAQTLEVKPDNAATAVGDIKIQNAMVITQPQRNAKGPAAVSATLFNNGRTDQILQSVKLANSGVSAQLKPAKGTGRVIVPAGGSVLLGGEGNASAVLPNGSQSVTDGSVQPVTFTFSRTGAVKMDTFVVPATDYFGPFGPTAAPSPTATATPGKPAKSPAAGTSPSGAASPSDSATGEAGAGGSTTPEGGAASASATSSAPAAGH